MLHNVSIHPQRLSAERKTMTSRIPESTRSSISWVLLLCGAALSAFGAYVCLTRVDMYYMEMYASPMTPMMRGTREIEIWLIAACFILAGLYVVRFAGENVVQRRIRAAILTKSLAVGIISMLCGIVLFVSCFYIYFRFNMHSELAPNVFRYDVVNTFLGLGVSYNGLAILFLGGPILLFMSGFGWALLAFRMKTRSYSAICIVVGTVVISMLSGCASHWQQHLAHRREAAYQAILRSYSNKLKPGTSRESVEQYVRQRNNSSELDVLPTGFPPTTLDDFVYIGHEPYSHYCSPVLVYVRFHFVSAKPDKDSGPSSTDILENLSVFYDDKVACS